jgi:hypothetical protein
VRCESLEERPDESGSDSLPDPAMLFAQDPRAHSSVSLKDINIVLAEMLTKQQAIEVFALDIGVQLCCSSARGQDERNEMWTRISSPKGGRLSQHRTMHFWYQSIHTSACTPMGGWTIFLWHLCLKNVAK